MRKVTLEIDNCNKCPNHYTERIYTADSFEHITGLYCSKVEDTKSCNKKHKLVAEDDWNVAKYSQIPEWCPLLKENENKENNVKIMIIAGEHKFFKSKISEIVQKRINDVEIINTHKDSLEIEISECYKNKKYKDKNIIIEVEALLNESDKINETCSKYSNCKMITTCDNPDLFTVLAFNETVDNIVNYFKQ